MTLRTPMSVVVVVFAMGLMGASSGSREPAPADAPSAETPTDEAPTAEAPTDEAPTDKAPQPAVKEGTSDKGKCIPNKGALECCQLGGGCTTQSACDNCFGCWESKGMCQGMHCRT